MDDTLIDTQKKLETELLQQKLISNDDLIKVKEEAKKNKTSLVAYLISQKLISDEDLTRITALVNDIPYVDLSQVRISHEMLELVPKDIAERYMAVALGETEGKLAVAMLDAGNLQAVDFLSNKLNRPLKVYKASETGIKNVLRQYNIRLDTTFKDQITDTSNSVSEGGLSASKKEIQTIVQDSPISKILTAILEFASRNGASDVHIEPTANDLTIRVRIDGLLREIMNLPKSNEAPLISRIKILSNLKIDEHRIPQDGQFTVMVDNKEVDLRIAIAPIVWGEQVVIRLLDKSSTTLKLFTMGYRGQTYRTVKQGIAEPNGMIITSGPTGSGKSTSLYALLQEIKSDTINIVTLEDPVEYKMSGINQIQVNTEVGLTFATGLRSILRQDPDVIMVGEIRDKETAQLAVQAALTGHLVLTSIHTNSSAGILPRLLDMDIEPFLIASTVRTVIGQRLIRKVGGEHIKYLSTKSETESIQQTLKGVLPNNENDRDKISQSLGYKNLPTISQNAYTLLKGIDSVDSPGGYKGRMGIYEAFSVDDKIQDLIMKRASSTEIQQVAQKEGMTTMRQDGYLKALSGQTTISEVNRVASLI